MRMSRTLGGLLATGVAFASISTAAQPAHAGSDSSKKTKRAGCIRVGGLTKSALVTLRTGADWSGNHKHVEGYASVNGKGIDCIRDTGVTATTIVTNSGHIEGRKISTCDIGLRPNCKIDHGHRNASWKLSLPKRSASARGRTIDISGIEAWAGFGGRLDDWYATGRTTLYYGGSSATATATIHFDI